MLSSKMVEKRYRNAFSFSRGRAALGFMSVLSLFLILRFPTLAIEYMERGMKLCVTTVIPSLFPFMVASELIVMSGAAEAIGGILKRPARLLFGISGEGCSAFLLGMVCGFPMGTRAAISLYREGRISHGELERLVCFSNNPSSAFVISAVGTALFGCREFGVALYVVTIISSVAVGVLQKVMFGAEDRGEPCVPAEKREAKRGIESFSLAVSSSASAMLSICAFVIFFSTFTGTLGVLISSFDISRVARALFFSFFELTGGVAEAAAIEPISLAVCIAAFSVGWSGLSVHFQMIGICDGTSVSLGRYFASKLLVGGINAALIWAYFKLFGSGIEFDVKSVLAFDWLGGTESLLCVVIGAFFFASLLFTFFAIVKKRIM